MVADVPMVSANECFLTAAAAAAISDSLPSVSSMEDLPERLRFTELLSAAAVSAAVACTGV